MTSATEQSVERLDVDNYATWRSRMKFLLIVSKACPERHGNHHRGGYSAIAL